MKSSKIIIISAPSGTGKSTLINKLLADHPEMKLRFSISATSRKPRGQERNGVEYYFLSPEAFREGIRTGYFLEYEEVYPDKFYGTPRIEVERLLEEGYNALFDVDTVGALSIKDRYGDRALAVFVMPPSIDELRHRLEARATDSPDVIAERIAKAEIELKKADLFDVRLINDDLPTCYKDLEQLLAGFLSDSAQ